MTSTDKKLKAIGKILSGVSHQMLQKQREWHDKLVDVQNMLCVIEDELKAKKEGK